MKSVELKFKALSDHKRMGIIQILLKNGQTTVCDLSNVVEMTQSKLSYHLKILLDADLIKKEEIGTWNFYEANQEGLKLLLSERTFYTIYSCKEE